jgi:pyridoxal/pyridoxine/pyridoxamine kinase
VGRAVEQALEYCSYSHDAVKHLLLSQRTPAQTSVPLNPDLIPGITDRWIAGSDLNRYDALLTGGAL